MFYWTDNVFYPQISVEFHEFSIYELPPVICYDGVQHPIPTYDVFPDKLLDLFGCNGC